MNNKSARIVAVAVPVPLYKTFDFLLPDKTRRPTPGTRVQVPFGKRKLVGVVISIKEKSDLPLDRLKPLVKTLDSATLFDEPLWHTLLWMSKYYLAPIGEVMHAALPAVLRQGADPQPATERAWTLSEQGRSGNLDELRRAPLQLALIRRFADTDQLTASDFKSDTTGWRQALAVLVKKGWLQVVETTPIPRQHTQVASSVELNPRQSDAVDALRQTMDTAEFSCSLLHGVTGSGKTEVYFALIRDVISRGQQALVLVPEIGLTPQLIQRVKQNFECNVVSLHSGLTDVERQTAWWHAQQGNAGIVIGTRSAIFTPFSALGLIIVDEEHDTSLKQQDGVRYHARDVAVYRAKQARIPCVLGSATPSLESMHNANRGRYALVELPDRALDATLPDIQLVDLGRQPTRDGLTPAMVEAIKATIEAEQQVMLFLNRRGYAPVLYCKQCGETSQCQRCDSNLTLHRASNRVRCHHCGYEAAALKRCQHCQSDQLAEIGEGTQRVEEAMEKLFPEATVVRIDRDSTRRKGQLEEKLQSVSDQSADIVLGTQLLAKGHDFSHIGMVGVLGADQGLHSTDFRAREMLFQQLLQVAGRAGRRQRAGRVLIQTAFPLESFFEYLKSHDYKGFCHNLLQQRQVASFPPFGFIALVRAESVHQAKALQLLRKLKQVLGQTDGANVMDAVAAPMERRAGRYRAQLLIQSAQRAPLHQYLERALHFLSNGELASLANSVRWSIDVDPVDLF